MIPWYLWAIMEQSKDVDWGPIMLLNEDEIVLN